eukprot:scaffold101267_cov45-Tisochrysis_lutea.AAC.1
MASRTGMFVETLVFGGMPWPTVPDGMSDHCSWSYWVLRSLRLMSALGSMRLRCAAAKYAV